LFRAFQGRQLTIERVPIGKSGCSVLHNAV
jgi:hypothetical protein